MGKAYWRICFDPAARTPPRSDVRSGRAADARREPRVEASAANHDQPAGAERKTHWFAGMAAVLGRWHRRRGRSAMVSALRAARAVPGVGQTALFGLGSYKVSINGKLGGRAEKLMARPKSQPSQLEGAARAAQTVWPRWAWLLAA